MKLVRLSVETTIAREDNEKLVTPAIYTCKAKDDEATSIIVGVGWWHYSIYLAIGLF